MYNSISNTHSLNLLRLKQLLIRYVTSISVFGITALFAPNFNFESFPILLLASLVIVLLDYIVATITGIHDSPTGRGIVGFVAATVIIYMAQFIVSGYYISILSSIIAALIYGVIDYFIPNESD